MTDSPFLNDETFFKSTTTNDGVNYRENLLVKALLLKAGFHKYVKRTGGSGNYKYWYRSKSGKLVEGAAPGGKEKKQDKREQLKQYIKKVRGMSENELKSEFRSSGAMKEYQVFHKDKPTSENMMHAIIEQAINKLGTMPFEKGKYKEEPEFPKGIEKKKDKASSMTGLGNRIVMHIYDNFSTGTVDAALRSRESFAAFAKAKIWNKGDGKKAAELNSKEELKKLEDYMFGEMKATERENKIEDETESGET